MILLTNALHGSSLENRATIQSFTGDAASGLTLGPAFTSTDTPLRMLFDSSGGTLFVVNASGTVDVIRALCTTGACRPPSTTRRRKP